MCRATESRESFIDARQTEKVRTYRYLAMHAVYTVDNREAELNHLVVQCKARMELLRSLAWSGRSVGVPLLRVMYYTTIISVGKYASPVLSCFDEGMWENLEKIQSEGMRIVVH